MRGFYPGKLDVVLEGSLGCGTLEACVNRICYRGLSIRGILTRVLEAILKSEGEPDDVAGRALVRNEE